MTAKLRVAAKSIDKNEKKNRLKCSFTFPIFPMAATVSKKGKKTPQFKKKTTFHFGGLVFRSSLLPNQLSLFIIRPSFSACFIQGEKKKEERTLSSQAISPYPAFCFFREFLPLS